MKKSMLTANHHQVTCWNENPFSPHYCAMIGTFSVISLVAGGEWEVSGVPHIAGSIQCFLPSITTSVFLELRKNPQRWVSEETWGCSLLEPQTSYQHLLPPLWQDCREGSLLPCNPIEKQPQTNRRAMKWCTRLYEDSRRTSTQDSQMVLDSSGSIFWADDKNLQSTDHLSKTVNLSKTITSTRDQGLKSPSNCLEDVLYFKQSTLFKKNFFLTSHSQVLREFTVPSEFPYHFILSL